MRAARDDEARHLFEAGRNAYDDGRYQDALDYFQRGYELSGRAALLYNVGQAADRLRQDETALDAFKRYLADVPDAPNRLQVEERIRVLEQVLAERRAAAVAPAATPIETGPAPAPAVSPLATQAAPVARDDQDGNVLNEWWFWAGVGGVVVATVVIVAVAAGSGGGGGGEVTNGSNGMTIAALRFP